MKEKSSAKKKKPIGLIIAAIILIGIAAYFLFIYNFVLDATDTYYIFTEKRISEMERQFGITVTDDIDLKKYKRDSWDLDCVKCTLQADDIADYHDFMEKNVSGEIVLMEENGVRYDFEENTQEKCDTGGYAAYYKYFVSTELNKYAYVNVYFYSSDNGKYSAKFNYFL